MQQIDFQKIASLMANSLCSTCIPTLFPFSETQGDSVDNNHIYIYSIKIGPI